MIRDCLFATENQGGEPKLSIQTHICTLTTLDAYQKMSCLATQATTEAALLSKKLKHKRREGMLCFS